MNSFEAAGAGVPDATVEPGNVREIFPGASQQSPMVNGWARTVITRGSRRWTQNGREAGMATAEYAIATLAAVGFAGLLVVILKSDEVRGFLMNIIRTALSF